MPRAPMHKYTDRPLWRWIIWEGSNAKPRLITARRPAVMHAWLRRGIGPGSCTYLMDLCFRYRPPRGRAAAVCAGGAEEVTFVPGSRSEAGRQVHERGWPGAAQTTSGPRGAPYRWPAV